MQASHYDPHAITLTAMALKHVRRQMASEGATALVLGVTKSGCNGYMYALDFAASAPPDARAFQFDDDVRVLVQETDWPLVRGTEIDYVTEGLNSALKFRNPNASAECGCGESFTIEP